jgi:hypothetical protein
MQITRTTITFEGTPAELEQSGLGPAFSRIGTAEPTPAGDFELSAEVREFLDRRMSPDSRAIAEAYLREVLSWGDVRAVQPRKDLPYVRLHRRGSALGAFSYVNPRKIDLRLSADHAAGYPHAQPRNVTQDNPHQVIVPLDEDGALGDAVALARLAYEQAL